MQVRVLFFGVLSELAGTDLKFYNEVHSTDDLLLRIADDYPDTVNYNFRVSLNHVILTETKPLADGDEVALMPPFSGG